MSTKPDTVTITIPAAVAEQLEAWRALTQEKRDEVLDDLDYWPDARYDIARMLLRGLA